MEPDIMKLLQAGYSIDQIAHLMYLRDTRGKEVHDEQLKQKRRQEFLKYLKDKGIIQS